MKCRKSNIFVNLALHILGFCLCILPPALCTISYFPIWKTAGYGSCIAGGTALILALTVIPIYKLIRQRLMSYSSYVLWLFLFLVFFGMSKIAEQMTVISLMGFVGNLLGAVCFHFASGKEVASGEKQR